MPTLTFTPIPPLAHRVQSGETCVSIATNYGITLDQLVAFNPDKCGSGGIIRPGDPLLVPVVTPTPGPGPTATVGPGTPLPTQQCPKLHIVSPGETGLGIAEQYGVPFSEIQRANPQFDFEQLPINQVLQIPCLNPTPTPTPTVDPNAAPTQIPKYAAPRLLSPPNGAAVTAPLLPLQWSAVSLLQDNEQYAVRLRRLDAPSRVISIYTRTTLIRLGEEYAPTLDEPVREYSWQVTVVRRTGVSPAGQPRYTAASLISAERAFRWLLSDDESTLDVPSSP
jgi:LysM repeat protein